MASGWGVDDWPAFLQALRKDLDSVDLDLSACQQQLVQGGLFRSLQPAHARLCRCRFRQALDRSDDRHLWFRRRFVRRRLNLRGAERCCW